MLIFAISTAFLFISCKNNTGGLTDSEQYYKTQLEKLVHLKETSSSTNSKPTSSFKTYKEAYEAFAFVKNGEAYSASANAVEVTEAESEKADGTAGTGDTPKSIIKYYTVSPALIAPIQSGRFHSSLGCSFTLRFSIIWTFNPRTKMWQSETRVTSRSEPAHFYSGLGVLDNKISSWNGLSFDSYLLGTTVIAGINSSWYIDAKCGTSIIPPSEPGGLPTVNSLLQAKVL